MAWKVLVSAPYFLPVVEEWRPRLAPEGVELIRARVNERLSEEELLEVVADIDGIICGDDRITERVLEAAPQLKVISKWGTGIDSIDSKAAAARGISVCRTRNAFSEPVADSALGYMLTFARKMTSLDKDIREGKWKKPQLMALGECVLGVVGVGDCGKAVVRRAVSFGMRVLGNDIVELPADFVTATGLEVVALDELLATADFVSLHTDLNNTSYHLIGKAQLKQMKTGAYLINTSRGPVVNEPELIDALQQRIIAGAALDVFEDEPLPADSPLRDIDNCLLAPHTANSSPKAWNRVHENTVRNLLEVLNKTEK